MAAVKAGLTFRERVGRSFARDPYLSMWWRGPVLFFIAIVAVSCLAGGSLPTVLALGSALVVAILIWFTLVLSWSRPDFLKRAAKRRWRDG